MSTSQLSSHALVRQALAKLKSTRFPFSVFSQLRKELPPETYVQFLAGLRTQKRNVKAGRQMRGASVLLADRLFNDRFPRKIQSLKTHLGPDPVTLRRELRWALAYIDPYVDELNRFLELSAEYDRAFLAGAFESCQALFGKIEATVGLSIWLLKEKIAFLQLTEGLEAQKKFVSQIKNEAYPEGIVAYIAHFVSVRNETTITTGRFEQEVSKALRVEMPEQLRAYLAYHIYPTFDAPSHSLAAILAAESSASVIDTYEAIIHVARVLFATANDESKTVLKAVLASLSGQVSDPRLNSLSSYFGIETKFERTAKDARAIDALLSGNVPVAAELAKAQIEADPSCSHAFEVAARTLPAMVITAHEEVPWKKLVYATRTVLLRDVNVDAAAADLLRTTLNHAGRPWAGEIQLLVESENVDEAPHPAPRIVRFAAAGLAVPNAFRVQLLDSAQARDASAQQLAAIFPNSLTSKYARLGSVDGEDAAALEIDLVESALMRARTAMINGDLSAALEHAEVLLASKERFYAIHGIRLKCNVLVALGRLETCIRELTSAYVADPNIRSALPIRRTVGLTDKAIRVNLAAELSVPLLFDLYSRHVGREFDSIRDFAYEDFLTARGVERPSELRTFLATLDKLKLIYFLRFVCVESVMDKSIAFSKSEQVVEERIEVLKFLLELDPAGVDSYQSELKSLFRRLRLSKRLRQIEQSKIYVDVDGIRRSVAAKMHERFTRYVSLLKAGVETRNFEEATEALRRFGAGDPESIVKLSLPENEASDVLSTIVTDLRDQFVLSTQYGLDGYLSVRVRHGTLAGQLRRPLEFEHLVTARYPNSEQYQPNEYWLEQAESYDAAALGRLDDLLAGFSKEFDTYVGQILREWIQVKRSPDEKGLIDMSLSRASIRLLAELITPETTFEEFLDVVFDQLIRLLEAQLSDVRLKIANEAKPRASQMLMALLGEVEELRTDLNVQALGNAIRSAHTQVQLAFDRVAEWFRFSRFTGAESFPIEEVIGTATAALQAARPQFEVELPSIPENALPIHAAGHQFATFVDIFFIIFENIVRHSNDSSHPRARIELYQDNGTAKFRILNPVIRTNDEADERISRIKAEMAADNYMRSVRREGGTGFHKIRKIFTHDLGIDPQLDFGFASSDEFFVQFIMPIHEREGG